MIAGGGKGEIFYALSYAKHKHSDARTVTVVNWLKIKALLLAGYLSANGSASTITALGKMVPVNNFTWPDITEKLNKYD